MKKIIFSLLLCCIIISVNIYAQSTPEEVIDKFFELYEKDTDAAVDYVFSTNKWMDKHQEIEKNVKERLKKNIGLIGKYYGNELILKKGAGKSYLECVYMVRYSRQPIKFTFFLYKPDSSWQIQNLKFGDDLTEDLKEYERNEQQPVNKQK